jgi:acyl-CoA reductase-like NAD-dependent aldehyde dehydrogenase
MKTADIKKQSEQESARIIEMVAKDTEQVIAKACEAAKREAEQELEKALREYEQKAKQIVLKIREEAKSRAAEIASRLGEAIMLGIEKSSTEAVADVAAEFSKKVESLTQTISGVAGGRQQPEGAAGKAKPGFEIEAEQQLANIIEDKTNGRTQQTSEDFEQWLTQ